MSLQNPLRPQTALKDIESGEHFYPMTCASQVLMEDGTRLNAYLENFEGGSGGNVDLSNYATIEYVNELLGGIENGSY